MTHDPDLGQPPQNGVTQPDRKRATPDSGRAGLEALARRGERRRDRIIAEIEANRRGEYKVPTWVLVVALAAMIAGIVALVVFA